MDGVFVKWCDDMSKGQTGRDREMETYHGSLIQCRFGKVEKI